MTKTNRSHESKTKMVTRIVCLVIAGALILTTLAAALFSRY